MIFLLGLFGLAEGMQGVIFNYLTSKILPVGRGVSWGLEILLADFPHLCCFLVGDYLVGNQDKLEGYSYSFIIVFL